MSRKTLVLKEPIQFGSETITELQIRAPKAKDFRAMPAEPTMGAMLDMLGRLAGQPKAVIDELCVHDMNAANEVIAGFTEGGPRTGSAD